MSDDFESLADKLPVIPELPNTNIAKPKGAYNRLPIAKWPPNLVLDLAEHDATLPNVPIKSEAEIALHYNLTVDDIHELRSSHVFQEELKAAKVVVLNPDKRIKQKMRHQFETFIDYIVPEIMRDPDAALAEKVKILQYYGKSIGVDNSIEIAEAEGKAKNLPPIRVYLTTDPSIQLKPYQPEEKVVSDA